MVLGKKIVATRVSQLAQCQTHLVCQWLKSQSPGFEYELLKLSTLGDRLSEVPLKDIGGKGVFVKELQQALLDHRADLTVHSMKDLPLGWIPELTLSGVYSEASPYDVLVSDYAQWEDLPAGSCIGTSSLRRGVQFLQLRPDCFIKPVRGNVLTRLERFNRKDFDGLILAQAGLDRLQCTQSYDVFEIHEMVPAFNQGILGMESRSEDQEISAVLSQISDRRVVIRMQWERAIAEIFNASCKSAIGVYAHVLSCDPLSVHLHVFACKNWDMMRTNEGVFDCLDQAIQWTKEQFDDPPISWAICQITFT
jgi:hydroxymethylbilane synthase